MKRCPQIGYWLLVLVLVLVLVGALSPQVALAQESGVGAPDGRAVGPGSSLTKPAPKAGDAKSVNRSLSTSTVAPPQQPVTGMPSRAPGTKGIGPKTGVVNPPPPGVSGTGLTRVGSGPAVVGGPAKANAGINGSTFKSRR